jgi:curved DNA-binding protein CbpA
VIDYFALVSEPRRPWLEPDVLKQKFLTLSASLHPDRIHSAGAAARAGAATSFAELNAAYTCLADPKSRLRHLLELELGAKPKDIEEIPAALADVFADVAMTCRSTDGFLAERSRGTSPLLQVQRFEHAQDWVDKLLALQQKLSGVQGQLLDELKALDGRWVNLAAEARHEILSNLEELYRLFGYFNRWNKQINERLVQLAI